MPAANPVLLKELRQSVRNRYVLAAYLLFLLGLMVVIGLMVSAWLTARSFGGGDESFGLSVFQTVYGIVTTVAVLFVPPYVASRLMRERWGNNLDLQFSTTIRPSTLARGKVLSGLAVAGLFFSGAVPFLAFSHLLRGIDLPSIFLCIAMALGVLVVLIQAAVLYAAFPAPKLVRALVGLQAVFSICYAAGALTFGAREVVTSGIAASLGTADSLRTLALVLGLWASVVLGLHALCVAALSPPCADRMRPVRLVATFLWATWGIGTTVAVKALGCASDAMEMWFVFSLLAAAGFAVQATSERTASSRRIVALIPRHAVRRVLAFPFTTGQVQGLTWSLLVLGITLLFKGSWSSATVGGNFDSVTAFALYVVAYALTVTLAWRAALRRVMSAEYLWVVVLALIVAGAVLPEFLRILAPRGTGAGWSFGSVFALDPPDALLMSSGWCLLIVVPFAFVIARAFLDFRRPPAPPPLPGAARTESAVDPRSAL